MKYAFALVMAISPIAAFAAAPFDGTWKTQLDTLQFSARPDVYELKGGTYTCSSCTPPYSVKADGTDQPVKGHSYYDTLAVREVDKRTVRIDGKLGGKTLFANTLQASLDGKSLAIKFDDMSGAKVVTGTQISKRVVAGPAGSHAISGSWQMEKMPDLSDDGTTVTYKTTADGMQMNYNGQTYDAKFDGKQYPTMNDPGKTMVSLKRISDHEIEETDTRNDKVTDITLMTVSADGKTMTVVDKDQLSGSTTQYKMVKQH